MNYVDEYIGALSSRSCGRDLEYTAEFIALEQAVRTAETVEYGEHVYVAQAIDWPHVESLCRGLYEQTLDLRVMVLLTRALLERCGLNGFLGGLRLVAWLVRQRWESVHPQLVADDQFDPLIRINTLAELAVPATVIALLKRQVLARTEDGQALCLGDLDVICGTEGVQHGEQVALLTRLIEPNCSAELMRSLGLMNALRTVLDEMTADLDEKTAVQGISPFLGLSKSLHKWARVIEDRLRLVVTKRPSAQPQERLPKAHSNERVGGNCDSREDVVRALDAICSYYQRHEPSSPVPFLIARVRRVTTMSFIDIIEELAPNSVTDLRRLGGRVGD
ncbi:type VI secretion system protein TssA [Pseudomonas fluorescens]|uniref:Type VI secretion system protein TssA n=1 Tax=Pseudomonas edaphica TaxID=2006980 RepID=A0A7Y7RP54_9PSED|nr:MULTISPECIES: type VI secretion system protein TssA [Pseudomonas]MBD8093265.1 type VI secretion system protein TssA [Pseudomonas fluorescens]MBD8719218.1 type VI secretion system protein TssA [Pseudomonas fluorescens]NMX56266.1 type VI secretion system protein TssA [Pseudomonas sp. WS 5146]NVZ55852.1 type VI secretion system protein TssA [Pseudomonas edaphica]